MRMSLAHSPFRVSWHVRREVAELLQDIDLFLKTVPQTGPQAPESISYDDAVPAEALTAMAISF